MSTIMFSSSINPILKSDGTVNAAGTIEFYQEGTAFATPIAVYSDADLTTSAGSIITLDAAGVFACYLNTDADIKIKDSAGSLIRSVYSINPSPVATTVESNFVVNGSFETIFGTNSPQSWTVTDYNVGANVVDTTVSNHGANSMKFVSAGNGGGYAISSLFPVSSVHPLLVSFSLKGTAATMRNVVSIVWYTAAQAIDSTTTLYDNVTTNPSSWTGYQYSTTAPSTAFYAAVKIVGGENTSATTGSTWFDDIRVVEDSRYKYGGADLYAVASGTDTYTATTGILALVTGKDYPIKITNTNTITTPTLNLDSTGAKTITRIPGNALLVGDLSGQHIFRYDGTNMICLNPVLARATVTQAATVNDTTVASTAFVYNAANADLQTFLASGTWTKPSGRNPNSPVRIRAWAGGGSGGCGAAGNPSGGGGGGSFQEIWKKLSDLGNTETITVGAGGAAKATTGAGNAGGNTTVGSLLTVYGGGAGFGDGAGGTGNGGGGGGGLLSAGSNATAEPGGAGGTPSWTNFSVDGGTTAIAALYGGGTGGSGPAGAGKDSIFGGGGGGAGNDNAGGANNAGTGGRSIWGGGGGGGAGDSVNGAAGGVSIFGGNGGAGATGAATATSGTQPSGGGGGAENGTSGAGGDGKVEIIVF